MIKICYGRFDQGILLLVKNLHNQFAGKKIYVGSSVREYCAGKNVYNQFIGKSLYMDSSVRKYYCW
jgi:hypothetical protein